MSGAGIVVGGLLCFAVALWWLLSLFVAAVAAVS